MKVFWCDNCGQLVFFENSQCVSCGCNLVFVPDEMEMRSFRFPAIDPKSGALDTSRDWKLCANYQQHDICNWAVPISDDNPLCRSCRLTRIIPNLEIQENVLRWYRLEGAKRRLLFTLLTLRLPVEGKAQPTDENGLAFEFLADPAPHQATIMTGHLLGTITVSVAEADDAERERRRTMLNEPYRTVLGHMRHEVGHYFWDLLVRDTDRVEAFRKVFGDERADYGAALQQYYAAPPSLAWQNGFVTSYASAHPWEDWAESWAHYLHIWDVLETAGHAGLRLRPKVKDAPSVKIEPPPAEAFPSFDVMIAEWFPLTYVINNLTRGLGQPDGYPFVLSVSAVEKLRFIHDVIADYVSNPPQPREPSNSNEAKPISKSSTSPPTPAPASVGAGSAPRR